MSDDAALWKLAFGALILAICGVTVALRKPPAAPSSAAVIAQPAPPPPAAATAPPARVEPPEAPPPRIEIVLDDTHEEPPVPLPQPQPKVRKRPRRAAAVASRAHVWVRRTPAVRIHRIVSTGPQYPFDPRERWNPRF